MFLLATQPTITLPGSGTGNVTVETPVAIGDTSIVDTVSLVNTTSTKWIVTITSTTPSKSRMFEISAVKGSTRVFSNMFGNIGDAMHILWDVIETGTDLQLLITNNEAFNITSSVVRIQTSPVI